MTSPHAPKALVFDIGGVLIDWDPRYLYRKLIDDPDDIERFMSDVTSDEWNAELDRGRDWDEAIAELAQRHPAHLPLIEAYRDRWIEMVRDAKWDVVAILEALQQRGVPVYCITNFAEHTLRLSAEKYPFLDTFDGIVVSGTIKLLKPDPAIYRALLDTYGLRAEDLYFTDDRPDNVAAARALGFASDVFTSADQLRGALQSYGLLA